MIYPHIEANNRTNLLTPYDVMSLTGLPYETALAFVRANGVKIGRKYYITQEGLEKALNKKN